MNKSASYIKIDGIISENKTTLIDGRTITILADTGAKLVFNGGGPVLKIQGNANITIYDLEITGAKVASGSSADGIQLANPGGGSSILNLIHVIIDTNAGNGITMTQGKLSSVRSFIHHNKGDGINSKSSSLAITQTSIFNNDKLGINASMPSNNGNTLSVTRSVIHDNSGGGIQSDKLAFAIINNFVYHNGSTTSSVGGLGLSNFAKAISVFEFNTIVDNIVKTGNSGNVPGGIFCDQDMFTASHNIIFRNTSDMNGNQTSGFCDYGDSFNSTDNNIKLGFSDVNDYHLTEKSPNSVVDAANACTDVDFDGDPRPTGGACDLGADERKP